MIIEACDEQNIDLLEMEIMPDHVHLLLEVDSQYGIHTVVKRIKGVTSSVLRKEFPIIKKKVPTLGRTVILFLPLVEIHWMRLKSTLRIKKYHNVIRSVWDDYY